MSRQALIVPQYTVPVAVGSKIACRCRCGRLVDQRPALLHLAVADEHGALGVESESLEVSI
ncbi:MAG: hypothetical protein H0U82_06730, partial [Actinobacteria bacterium]|nr:hypothetical protein [Actinomycetota bacterium]